MFTQTQMCPAYTYMHLENTLMILITYQLTSTNRQMKTLVASPTTGSAAQYIMN